THSLQYFYTAVTPGINFPEFTAVGLMDGEQCVYYDSNIRKMIPKTEWIQNISADDPDYWNRETERMKDRQDIMATVMKILNQNEGNHTLQWMFGCALDNRDHFEDTELDPKGEKADYWKDYLKYNCIDHLEKFVSYSKETLKKKVPPTASVIQKHSPSPEVVCHATGFFPEIVNITWRKDGEEVRETLPNQDGSFQKRSILKVPAEELQKHNYTCVIQHSSLEEELVLEVPKGGELGGGSGGTLIGIIIGVVIVLFAVVAGLVVSKKKKMSSAEKPNEVQQNGTELQPLNTPPSDAPV
ncbi:hypothetical protein QTP70_014198, partial [Hemibagrus guttatus]